MGGGANDNQRTVFSVGERVSDMGVRLGASVKLRPVSRLRVPALPVCIGEYFNKWEHADQGHPRRLPDGAVAEADGFGAVGEL